MKKKLIPVGLNGNVNGIKVDALCVIYLMFLSAF